MSHARFLLDESMSSPGVYHLNREESHHAVNVLRLRPDDAVIVFDGRGHRAEALVADARKDRVSVRVDMVHTDPRLPLKLTIATAIPKGKRWQTLVEKCTELGVDAIIPILTERSVVKGEGDIGKWRRWMVEAAKQSRRSWIPEIVEPEPFAAVFEKAREREALLFVADGQGESPSAYREQLLRTPEAIALVGPEGGFTGEELAECARRGAKSICLSPFVLRIETAAATVCAILREAVL